MVDVQISLRLTGVMAFFLGICAIASWVGVSLVLAEKANVQGTLVALGILYVISIVLVFCIWDEELVYRKKYGRR